MIIKILAKMYIKKKHTTKECYYKNSSRAERKINILRNAFLDFLIKFFHVTL